MRLASVALTKAGVVASSRIASIGAIECFVPKKFADVAPSTRAYEKPVRQLLADIFSQYDGLVLFMALGAAVRLIAPLLIDKFTDPAVVVVDDAATFAISVLSGHTGGANALAQLVAEALDATPVITTASDVRGLPALDLLGKSDGWKLSNSGQALTRAAAALLNGESIGVFQDAGDRTWQRNLLNDQLIAATSLAQLCAIAEDAGAVLLITDQDVSNLAATIRCPYVVYRPPTLVVGIGCSKGAPVDELEALLRETLAETNMSAESIAALATIDVKASEPGLLALAKRHAAPLRFFSAAELRSVRAPNPSAAVERAVGTPGVCEPAALLAAGVDSLLLPKRKSLHATIALARRAEAQL